MKAMTPLKIIDIKKILIVLQSAIEGLLAITYLMIIFLMVVALMIVIS